MSTTLNDQAVKAAKSGNVQEALRLFLEAVKKHPNEPKNYVNLGFAYRALGDSKKTIANFQKAVELTPRTSENESYYYNLALLLAEQGKKEEAIEVHQKIIKLNPGFAKSYFNLGSIYQDLGMLTESVEYFEQAAKQSAKMVSNIAQVHVSRGVSLGLLEQSDEAIKAFREALEIEPDNASALTNIGIILRKQKKFDDALKVFSMASVLQPNNVGVLSYLNVSKLDTCDWIGLYEIQERLTRVLNEYRKTKRVSESPFFNVSWSDDKQMNFDIAEAWSEGISRKIKAAQLRFKHDPKKRRVSSKIRLGYLSADFYAHAVAHACVNLFGMHDRKRFEVYAYSYGPDDGSWYRKKIMEDVDKFTDIRTLSFIDAAKKIHDDKIDILIDLTSHTEGRMEVSALRPAPIQVTWIGFPGGSGSDFFDYVIADKVIAPPEDKKYFTEKLVYMPDTHWMNNNQLYIAPIKYKRKDFNLPDKGTVYACFNGNFKIDPIMFEVWMNILKKVSGSVLWLTESSPLSTNNLRKEAEKMGVDPNRIVLSPRMNEPESMARHKLVDIYLNTRLFNGCTTVSDALFMNIPVITLLGNHFASRQASGLLTAIGMPELIAHDLGEYEKIAVEMGNHPTKYKKSKEKLKKNRKTYPLFNTKLFVKNLETAYKKIWKLYLDGKKPEDIHF